MISIIKHDIRKSFDLKILLGVVVLMLIYLVLPIGVGSLVKIQLFVGQLLPLIIMYIGAFLFTCEFENGSYKSVFTGKYTRLQILFIKLLATLIIAVLMAGFLCVVFKAASIYDGAEFGLIDVKNVLQCLVIFTMLVSSVGFLAAVICKNFMATYLVLFVLFYDFFNKCLILVAEGIRNEGIKIFLLHIPLYEALSGLQRFSYSNSVMTNILIVSMISIVLSGVILQKRDLL